MLFSLVASLRLSRRRASAVAASPVKPCDVAQVVQLQRHPTLVAERPLSLQAFVVQGQRLLIATLPADRFNHVVESGRDSLLIVGCSSHLEAGLGVLLHHQRVVVED